MEELGYLRRVLDAQTDEGEDADFGDQTVVILLLESQLGLQEGIELIDEVGVKVQEHGVEVLQQLVELALFQLR